MQQSNSPAEYYQELEAADKKIIDEWNSKRASLLQSMMSKSIEDSMRNDPLVERKSKAYVKLLVMAFSPKGATENNSHRTPLVAELTIWRVSDEQFDQANEGAVLRMKNLVVKSESKHGVLQLSANHETPIEALSQQPSYEQLIQSGYNHRAPMPLIKINILAKQQLSIETNDDNRAAHEFDVIACVVKVSQVGDNTTVLYLTDESGLVIKLKRDHKVESNDPFSLSSTALPAVVAFHNLRIASFDKIEHCAVAVWELLSYKANQSTTERFMDLQSWCNSEDGFRSCNFVLDKVNLGLPLFGRSIENKVCFGYILCAHERYLNAFSTSNATITIDCGGKIVEACLSMPLVHQAIRLLQNDDKGPYEKSDLQSLNLQSLNHLLCCNQMLLRIALEETSNYQGKSHMLQVTDISIAKVEELVRLHF